MEIQAMENNSCDKIIASFLLGGKLARILTDFFDFFLNFAFCFQDFLLLLETF